MAIQYAGGSRVNYTFTDAGMRADLVSKLETQLGNAGWSTISGAGTGDVLMKSAVTADGLSMRLRLYDPGSGNCAQFTMKNNAGDKTSQIFYLLPYSGLWRIVANKYSFAMFKSGAALRKTARAALFGGTIWVPDFVLDVMAGDLDCGYMMGTGSSDTDTTVTSSWRSQISVQSSTRGSCLFRSFMLDHASGATDAGVALLVCPNLTVNQTLCVSYEWEGGRRSETEPIVGWSPDSSASTRAKKKGLLWDAMIESGLADGETTITFDGHTFIAITDQCDANVQGVGTLYMAID